jgi:protease I
MANKRLAGIKVLMVIAPELFRDEELLTPKRLFSDAGATVVTASTALGEAIGMLGARVQPEIVLASASSADYEAIIVVGGMGSPTHLWNNGRLHEIISEMHKDGKVVAAICLSSAALAKAGVLEGKRATVYSTPDSLKALQAGKAHYTEQHVVQDGKIITADGPEAAHEFAEKIVAELSKIKV